MEKILKLLDLKEVELSLKIKKALENQNYSQIKVSCKEELRILKTRKSMFDRKQIQLVGFNQTIESLEEIETSDVLRYIIIGDKKSFVLYTDVNVTKLIGWYFT